MASILSAGTTTSTALNLTADVSGALQLASNNGTTALTINTTQAIGVGSSPSYGTNGQVLTSSGSGAAPTWTTVSAASLATPSFTTTIGVGGATASASGAGITFPATFSNSTNANTLDDYEEGSFTVTGTKTSGASYSVKSTFVVYNDMSGNPHVCAGYVPGSNYDILLDASGSDNCFTTGVYNLALNTNF
jgi:hypothetical protein